MGHTVQLTSQIQLTKYDCIIPILAPLRNKWIWLIILHTRFPRNRFKIQTLSLWFRLFDHQNVLLYVYLIMSSLPSSKVHNWLCPSHCPQISMSGPAPWFDKSRLILAFGTEILEIQWVMFRNWTRQNNLPKVLIASLLPPNVPDVFFLKRDNLGSIRRAPILYTSIHSGLKTPDGPSVVLPIKHPLRFIRGRCYGYTGYRLLTLWFDPPLSEYPITITKVISLSFDNLPMWRTLTIILAGQIENTGCVLDIGKPINATWLNISDSHYEFAGKGER